MKTVASSPGKKQFNPFGYETKVHSHAWAIEPLRFGYVWIKKDLPEDEAEAIEAALYCAAR